MIDMKKKKPKPCSNLGLHSLNNLNIGTQCNDCKKTVLQLIYEQALSDLKKKIRYWYHKEFDFCDPLVVEEYEHLIGLIKKTERGMK